jgi:hypothetical protein
MESLRMIVLSISKIATFVLFTLIPLSLYSKIAKIVITLITYNITVINMGLSSNSTRSGEPPWFFMWIRYR